MGSIAYFAGQSSAPDGWILCDGTTVNRDTYATLFSAIGTTYGAGDGSTTFTLPNLIDKFVEGSATSGTVKSAGLPNIVGAFSGRRSVFNGAYSSVIFEGNHGAIHAFNNSDSGVSVVAGGSGGSTGTAVEFNASWSSSIYGNSTTVQPPALTMKPFIYTGKTNVNKWLRTA